MTPDVVSVARLEGWVNWDADNNALAHAYLQRTTILTLLLSSLMVFTEPYPPHIKNHL